MSSPLHSPATGAAAPLRGDLSPLVRLELWRSLVSSIKVYACDPNLACGTVMVAEPNPAEAIALCGGARLRLSMDPANGIGEWSLEPHLLPGDEGSFQVREAGTVSWNREEKEFDQAAIEWVGDLVNRAKRQQELQRP